MADNKAVTNFYPTSEEIIFHLEKNVKDFFGLNNKAKTFGSGSFDLKLYHAQNLDILSQQ